MSWPSSSLTKRWHPCSQSTTQRAAYSRARIPQSPQNSATWCAHARHRPPVLCGDCPHRRRRRRPFPVRLSSAFWQRVVVVCSPPHHRKPGRAFLEFVRVVRGGSRCGRSVRWASDTAPSECLSSHLSSSAVAKAGRQHCDSPYSSSKQRKGV